VCYKFVKEYGRLFRVWLFNYPQVVIGNAKDAEKILPLYQHNAKSINYTLLRPWLGSGLVVVKGNIKLIASINVRDRA
jgi:hypothetical protein